MEKLPVIGTLYKFAALNREVSKHEAWEATHPLTEAVRDIVDETAMFGIEVEVENMPNYIGDIEAYWNMKQDHSLRNHGQEFTSIPLRAKQLQFALNYLKEVITRNNQPEFSNRCSVHVHLNVRDMTPDQYKSLVMLYTLFEKHFFHIAGTKRENSIFCVPLTRTRCIGSLSDIMTHCTYWPKYHAINLGTTLGSGELPKFGTVEFRHLYGTLDMNILFNWLNNIMCLRKAAMELKPTELFDMVARMNTTSEYVQLYDRVFGKYANHRMMAKHDFESAVTFVKQWEWGTKLHSTYKAISASAYFLAYRKEYEYGMTGYDLEGNYYFNKRGEFYVRLPNRLEARLYANLCNHTEIRANPKRWLISRIYPKQKIVFWENGGVRYAERMDPAFDYEGWKKKQFEGLVDGSEYYTTSKGIKMIMDEEMQAINPFADIEQEVAAAQAEVQNFQADAPLPPPGVMGHIVGNIPPLPNTNPWFDAAAQAQHFANAQMVNPVAKKKTAKKKKLNW